MQFIRFIQLASLLQMPTILAATSHHQQGMPDILRTSSPLNCSQYGNDNEIIKQFSFDVKLNPLCPYTTITHAVMKDPGKIHSMNIANEKKCIPPAIYCLKHLKELFIHKTSFCDSGQRLSPKIAYLASSLIHLRISDIQINYLPRQIGILQHLKTLELSNVSLMALPPAIGQLSALEFLSLPNNKLKSLPNTIANLRSVRQITLTNNPYLWSIQSINGLPSLRTLETSRCPIAHLPRDLPKLTYLDMSHNNLTDLDGIERLGNGSNVLKTFNFDHNHLRSIPPQIRHVRHLQRLKLNDNQLDDLPTDIFHVTTLCHLSIKNNRFRPYQKEDIEKRFRDTNPTLNLYISERNSTVQSIHKC